MLLFGHIGLTMGLARALSREIDARWVAATSVLPDVIDKPLRYVMAPAFTQGNTRTVGHSLTVMLVGMAVVGLLLRRKIRGAGIVALLLPLHLLLDGRKRALAGAALDGADRATAFTREELLALLT